MPTKAKNLTPEQILKQLREEFGPAPANDKWQTSIKITSKANGKTHHEFQLQPDCCCVIFSKQELAGLELLVSTATAPRNIRPVVARLLRRPFVHNGVVQLRRAWLSA